MPTLVIPNVFTPNTTILSAETNSNNTTIEGIVNALDSLNIVAKGVNADRLADGANPEVFFAETIAPSQGFVETGLTFVSSSLLTVDLAVGTAFAVRTSTTPNGFIRVRKSSTSTVSGLSPTSDNYIDLKSDGTFVNTPQGIGGTAPGLATDSTRIILATTDATTVTGTTDLRSLTFSLIVFPIGYWNNIFIEFNAATPDEKIDVRAGLRVRDRDNTFDIIFASAKTLDATTTGAGGLDTGSLAANEKWFIFSIDDSSGGNVEDVFASKTIGVTPPTGFDKIRRIGAFFTDATSDIIHYIQQGNEVIYRDEHVVSTSNGAAAFADVSVAAFVPTTTRVAKLFINTSGGSAAFFFSEGGRTGTTGGVKQIQTTAASDQASNEFHVMLNSTQDYAFRASPVGITTEHAITGYFDDLGQP